MARVKIDERVYALYVWRSPDGNEHPQWTAEGDPRPCRCGVRHTLSEAASAVVCPGVAHVEHTRPCVLCGLGWRVPKPPGYLAAMDALEQAAPAIAGAGFLSAPARHIYIDVVLPPLPRCVYCMTLAGPQDSAALAHHRAQFHPQENS